MQIPKKSQAKKGLGKGRSSKNMQKIILDANAILRYVKASNKGNGVDAVVSAIVGALKNKISE